MLMTTMLLTFYLAVKKVSPVFIAVFLLTYISVEASFLAANLLKFMHGGYVSLIIWCLLMIVMWRW